MKAKRILVPLLSMLTIGVGMLGLTACQQDKEVTNKYDVTINVPAVENCVHDYSVVYYEQEADCFYGIEGYKEMGCSKCGAFLTVYTGMGHDYGDASCTEPASCILCGAPKNLLTAAHKMVAAACEQDAYCSECYYVEYGTALEHVVVEATCTADSYCSVCNKNFGGKHNVVSAFGSLVEKGWLDIEEDRLNYDENGYAYIAPTCDTAGYEAFNFCETCLLTWAAKAGVLDVEEYPEFRYVQFDKEVALDFILFMDALDGVDDPTDNLFTYLFGESGITYTEGFEIIPASHTMVNYFGTHEEVRMGVACVEVMPNANGEYIATTCVTNGLMNFKVCINCFHNYGWRDATTYYEIQEMVTPSEYDGWRAKVYAEGFEEATIAALGHTSIDENGNNSFVAGKPATCTEAGVAWSAICQRCHIQMNEYIDQYIAPHGHNYNGQEPTCYQPVKCINCAEEWSRDHVMSSVKFELSKAPTCTEAGYENVTVCTYEDCTYCEFTSIPMLNHSWTAYSEAADKESVTCVEGLVSKDVYKCWFCEQYAKLTNGRYTITTSIYDVKPMTTHTKSDAFIDATCELAAQNTECAYCGKEDVFARAALGHKYVNAATTTTCFQDGKCTRENCDYYDGIIPAFEHYTADGEDAIVPVEAKAPTCTTTGYVAHEKCTLCNNLFYNGTMEVTVGYDAEGNPVTVKHSTREGGTLFLARVSHVYEEVAEKLPTCEEAGYSAHEVCVNCGNKAGYTTNGYAKKACASDIASCYETVACNHSYIVIEGTDDIVAEEGLYVIDYYTGEFRLATTEEIEFGYEYIYETEWRGCGELTATTNIIPCVDHDQGGYCVVCSKFVGHEFALIEGTEYYVCNCGMAKKD